MQNTLTIKHYHIVFTVPHQLNPLPAQWADVLRPALCCYMEYTPLVWVLAFRN
jgi:hypothetical protein